MAFLEVVGEVDDKDIERVEEFLEMVKSGRVESFVIVAPVRGDKFEMIYGGCYISVEMLGRLEYVKHQILKKYSDDD